MKIDTCVEIELDDFANALSYKEATEIIKAIDLGQCELDFTLEMTKWFIQEVIKCDTEGEYVNDLLKMLTD